MARNRRARLPRNPCNKLIAFIMLLLCGGGVAAFLPGRVISVADGETIIVLTSSGERQKIRLYGVDCPESEQAGGKAAAKFTSSLVLFANVKVQKMDTDRYDRTVAIVALDDGRILNEELVKNGHAWVYPAYCNTARCAYWQTLEAEAKADRIGLWRDKKPMPPWQWRRYHPR